MVSTGVFEALGLGSSPGGTTIFFVYSIMLFCYNEYMTKDEKTGLDFALNNFKAPRLNVLKRKFLPEKNQYKVRVIDKDYFRCTLYFDKCFIDRCIEITKKGQRHWSK